MRLKTWFEKFVDTMPAASIGFTICLSILLSLLLGAGPYRYPDIARYNVGLIPVDYLAGIILVFGFLASFYHLLWGKDEMRLKENRIAAAILFVFLLTFACNGFSVSPQAMKDRLDFLQQYHRLMNQEESEYYKIYGNPFYQTPIYGGFRTM
jgi:hypothetical protein